MMYYVICCMMLAVLLAAAGGCAPESSVVWVEGEDYTDAPKGLEQVTQPRLPGSGGQSSTGATFARPDMKMVYSFTVPADLAEARLVLRYARLHWRESMQPVTLVCELTQDGKPRPFTVTCGNTGGWGTKLARDWQLAEVKIGQVAKGPATLVIHGEKEPADVNVDGFFIAPKDVKITADEFHSLNRLLITGRGYMGIDQMYSAVEQQSFTGFNVVGRGFVPHSVKVNVTLVDAEGNDAAVLHRNAALAMEDEGAALAIIPEAVKKVPDGVYSLKVAWGDDGAVLEMPFVTMGKLAAAAEKKAGDLKAYIAANGKNKDARVRQILPDLRYAAEYIDKALVLLRSRRHADQPASAFKAALAYFEKSRTRTAAHFARDVKTILEQTDETLARVTAGQDPYADRRGDFRRAFISKTTKKLEPYRLYLPASYGKGKKLPVILMLHGGGGDENSFLDQEEGAVPAVLEKRGYVGIAPKATSWYGEDKNAGDDGIWDMGQLVKLVLAEYPGTDPARVYCTGVSRGGFGTYRVAYNHPGLFRAIAPVSGIGSRKFLDVRRFKKTPVLIIHGGADNVVPVTIAKDMSEKFKKAGVDHELKVFPKYGHNYHGEEYLTCSLDFFEKQR